MTGTKKGRLDELKEQAANRPQIRDNIDSILEMSKKKIDKECLLAKAIKQAERPPTTSLSGVA